MPCCPEAAVVGVQPGGFKARCYENFFLCAWSMINAKINGRSRADADLILYKEQLMVGKVEMISGGNTNTWYVAY